MNSPIQPIPYEDKYLDQILSFLAKFSPDHPELGDRGPFQWQRCQRYLAFSRGQIVGHMAVIPQIFNIDGTEKTIGWGATLVLDMSDFAVKTFAGTALLDKVMNDPSYIYAGVGIVPEIEPSYHRLGYVICRESVRMYARFFKPGKALKYYNKSGLFSFPLAVMNIIRPAAIRSDHGELTEITRFDESLDKRWKQLLSSQYEVYGQRNASFLNYKMSQPGKKYRAFLHKDRQNEIDGYMILREARHKTRDLYIVKVCDLVGTSTAKRDLLARAVGIARELRVDGIVAVSSRRDRTIFKQAGLWLERVLPIGLKPELAGKMQLSFFDSDLDNLW
jgi:hypothetical protein